jgi:hypothetical protein
MGYCDRCRREYSPGGVVIPWSLVDADPDAVMLSLYVQGYTKTAPAIAADVLELDHGQWVAKATDLLAESGDRALVADPEECSRLHVTEPEPLWQRRLRLQQARWREANGYPEGHTSSGRPLGSRLEASFAAETWANFLTPGAAARARLELTTTVGVMEETRMLTNLLSSQPLCFNLFADLDTDPDHRLATAWARRLWPRRVERVTAIRFEYSPGRGVADYLDNRSAFDVFIEYEHRDGGPGFVGIEVKYHENLSKGKSNDVRQRALDVAAASGAFVDPASARLTSLPLSQLFLDHLLALSMVQRDEWRHGLFVLLYPRDNKSCADAIPSYQEQLTETDTFEPLTLEAAIGHLQALTQTQWVHTLCDRYVPSLG